MGRNQLSNPKYTRLLYATSGVKGERKKSQNGKCLTIENASDLSHDVASEIFEQMKMSGITKYDASKYINQK